MRELVNWMADPIRSFPLVVILFCFMMKYYRVVGTKKFAWIAGSLFTVTYILSAFDPNFFYIITWPDNIPITLLVISVGFLTWLAIYKASINDERHDRGEIPVEALPENREKVWCWPNLVYTELFAIICGTVFLIVWAIVFKAPLEEPANPTWAPNPAKAPWYFLGLQEMLVYFDPWMAGVVLPGVIIVGLVAIPYIDTNPAGNGYFTIKERPLAITGFLFGWLVLWIYLIIVGTFLRGPNWTFYGPFEYWDFHKVVAEYNINLSEFLWIKWLNSSMPKNIVLREIFGIILTCLYLFLLPPLLVKTKKVRELVQRIGYCRYYILMGLVVLMLSLPIKMILRWAFGLKYVIALPEWELNL